MHQPYFEHDGAGPFDSIEGAHEYIVLLEEAIAEAASDVHGHIGEAQSSKDARQIHALNLALLKLNQLSLQMHKSKRSLNDLRTIRRLLFDEREPHARVATSRE